MNLTEEERNVLSAMERIEANDQAEKEYYAMEKLEEKTSEIAESMLADGFTPEIVAKHTKLSLNYVMELYECKFIKND